MFETRLNAARNGRGILFCGAGFSADCLNFTDAYEIGVGAHLLNFLNAKLDNAGHDSGYKDLRNAADSATDAFGEYGLLKLLQERFKIENVTADMVEICQYPWERIFTTNYDNAIELAAPRGKVNINPINNMDSMDRIESKKINAIHLHGRAESWNIENFRNSCILGMESYHSLSFLKGWLDFFRQDLDRAEIVAFVGFNASDFHLNDVLRDISGLRDKVFFINRASAEPDVDIKKTQKRFGTPLYIGRQGFADILRKVKSQIKPVEPVLSSFEQFVRCAPAIDVPPTKAIEDLFIFGRVQTDLLARDIDLGLSDYHLSRTIVSAICDDLSSRINIALLYGDICDGKSIATQSIVRRLNVNRPVFILKIPYDDILDESAKILDAYKNSAIIIENCFDLSRERLVSLARQVNGTSAVLFLTCRSIAAEARVHDLATMRELSTFREYRMPNLSENEANLISKLADQIAGWSEFRGYGQSERSNYIKTVCNSSLPSFLLRLLRSEYVKGRYREEYNKLEGLNATEQSVVIGALYIAHMGVRPQSSFLSDIFRTDVGGMLMQLDKQSTGLRLVRLQGNVIESVPAIGATNLLRDVIEDRVIVDVVFDVLRRMSEDDRRDDFRRHLFSQMMRYSIIKPVIEDEKWISRFFDKVSKIDYVRRQVLFWLQWSIALREQRAFVDAEKKLEQGYREAEAYEKRTGNVYDRRQLDDVRAKLVVAHARSTPMDSMQLFRDLQKATEIAGRLLKSEDLTHHPYETLEGIVELFHEKGSIIDAYLLEIITKTINGVILLAENRIGVVPAGYQVSKATDSLARMRGKLRK